MPEVGLLETLQCLFDRGCVLHKSVHLGHWLGISECGHFPQGIVRPGARGMMRRRGCVFTLCCLTSFFISSSDCSSAVGSTWVCVLWDVNKKSLIVSCSCKKLPLFSPSLFTHAHTLLSFVVFSVFPWSPLLCPWSCLVWAHRVCLCDCGQCHVNWIMSVRSAVMTGRSFVFPARVKPENDSAYLRTVKEKWDHTWVVKHVRTLDIEKPNYHVHEDSMAGLTNKKPPLGLHRIAQKELNRFPRHLDEEMGLGPE